MACRSEQLLPLTLKTKWRPLAFNPIFGECTEHKSYRIQTTENNSKSDDSDSCLKYFAKHYIACWSYEINLLHANMAKQRQQQQLAAATATTFSQHFQSNARLYIGLIKVFMLILWKWGCNSTCSEGVNTVKEEMRKLHG